MFKKVVCTDQLPKGALPSCASIVSIGANSSVGDVATEQLSIDEVVEQIDCGIVFYVVGPYSGKVAIVEKYWCIRCRKYHLRTRSDGLADNNLDSLRYCQWKAA